MYAFLALFLMKGMDLRPVVDFALRILVLANLTHILVSTKILQVEFLEHLIFPNGIFLILQHIMDL